MHSFPERKQSDYIRIYRDVISAEDCEKAISMIEGADHELLVSERKRSKKRFWVYYIEDSTFEMQMNMMFENVYHMYRYDMNLTVLPPHPNFGHVKIKRYDKGSDDRFLPHVDVTGGINNQRYLAMLLYLNDVDEGGETIFECLDEPIKPERGKCVVFPPLWLYKHQALPAISHSKYSIQTYARYK